MVIGRCWIDFQTLDTLIRERKELLLFPRKKMEIYKVVSNSGRGRSSCMVFGYLRIFFRRGPNRTSKGDPIKSYGAVLPSTTSPVKGAYKYRGK